MNWLIIKNDLKRNKIINLVLFLFMIFSSCLAILSVVTAVQTFTSISELYETAQPPHFLQMHKGDIDIDKIDNFMQENGSASYWQVCTMIDVYGDNLTVKNESGTYDLSDCSLDIGMIKQNHTRDLILNDKHEKVQIDKGGIGVPVLLSQMYEIKTGDLMTLQSNGITKEFTVTHIVLDSMMNSTMTSSTRLLLSDSDFDILEGVVGENEYLIEAYFKEPSAASDFQTSYENAGLAQNGQAITYTIIFILSALTDLVTVFVLLLVSLLLVIVSFICVKFTIMASLEEEMGEIGAMKAIGLSYKDIRSLYLYKYRMLSALGAVLGYILALIASGLTTEHISSAFGDVGMSPISIICALAAAIISFMLINFYCSRVLKKVRKLTVVDTLVTGRGIGRAKGKTRDGLHKAKKSKVNFLMGSREVIFSFGQWSVVFAITVIAVILVLIPANLLSTFESPEFITYMGSSKEDILIEIENGENLETNYQKVKTLIENDNAVSNYFEYKNITVQTLDTEAKPVNLHIDAGLNAGNELKYLSGAAPSSENEIAISYLNAQKTGKSTDDIVMLSYNGHENEFKISGIYQDVTSGGYTAKSKYEFTGLPIKKYSFSVNLKDNENINKKAEEWTEVLGAGVTASAMEKFIDQTLGGVSSQLKLVVYASTAIAGCLAFLITVLFLRLRLVKDLSETAILKAIGFTNGDIKKQYLIKIGLVSLVGIAAGTLTAKLFGSSIVSAAIELAGIGIKRVELISNLLMEYFLCPLLLLGLIMSAAILAVGTVKKYNIIKIINE